MLSRRGFLRRLVSAGVVAAVAPAVLLEHKENLFDTLGPLPDGVFKDTPIMQAIQAKHFSVDVEITYKDLMFGYDEPDLMWVRPDVFETLEKILQDKRYSQEFQLASV